MRLQKQRSSNFLTSRALSTSMKLNRLITSSTECGVGEFSCDTSRCIPETKRCDQIDDCDDKSDESNCPEPTTAAPEPGECTLTLKLDHFFNSSVNEFCEKPHDVRPHEKRLPGKSPRRFEWKAIFHFKMFVNNKKASHNTFHEIGKCSVLRVERRCEEGTQ